jgi:uncharacterized GH25 family protein
MLFIAIHNARECTRIRCGLLAALLLCLPLGAAAHDFWIEPDQFRPPVGTKVPTRLFVGQDFKGESAPYIPELIERFVAVDEQGPRALRGITGDDPAAQVTLRDTGLTVLGYQSKSFIATFDTLAEFEQYLLKEGLEQRLARARQRGERRIVEHYYRCAKALLAPASTTKVIADRVLGFPLELIAEQSPYLSARLNALDVRLNHQGQPLAGALVVAFRKQDPQHKVKVRTDTQGRARLPLAGPGLWLVTSVHMVPAPLLSRADWISYWASLTFLAS